MKSEKNKPVKLKKLKSVKSAMWGYFCLLAVLLVFIVEILFYFVMMSSLSKLAREKVESVGKEIVGIASFYSAQSMNSMLINYLEEGVDVYVFSVNGDLLAPNIYTDEAELNELFSELSKRVQLDDRGKQLVYSKDNCCYFGAVTSPSMGVQQRYVLVSFSMNNAGGLLLNMQIYMIIFGLVVLILSFAIAYLMSQKLTSGLKTISDTTLQMAKGEYSVEFTNTDYAELAALSGSLNNLRDEVKKSGDFQRELLANVTHDLKTPLTMIKAYASMIKEISGDIPEKRNAHLDVIINEADRLTGLVNDILSVSKVKSNLNELNLKVFNLTDYLYGIIDKFGYLQESMGYSLMIDIDANLYTCADEEKIGQVIYNLLGNAANYTGADKTVYISLKESLDGKRIKFSVKDTGKGIKSEDLKNIWERYYRVKETHNRPVKGTGLGLNIVKVILENHKFDFGVDSEVNKGTTFWVDFPSVEAEPKDEPVEEQPLLLPPPKPSNEKRKK